MDNCRITCQAMADMKKVYGDLIVINLYKICSSWSDQSSFLKKIRKIGKISKTFMSFELSLNVVLKILTKSQKANNIFNETIFKINRNWLLDPKILRSWYPEILRSLVQIDKKISYEIVKSDETSRKYLAPSYKNVHLS